MELDIIQKQWRGFALSSLSDLKVPQAARLRDVIMRTVFVALIALCLASGLANVARAAEPQEAVIRHWTEEAQSRLQRGDTRGWAEALARRAEAYQSLGHRREALADLEQAAGALKDGASPALRAAVLGALGQAYFRAGRTDEAAKTLGEALPLAESSGAPRIAAAIRNDQGMVLAATGRPAEAAAAFADSLARARASNDPSLAAKAMLNAARLSFRQSDLTAAARMARDAAASLGALPDSDDKAIQLAATGAMLRELGPAADAAGARAAYTVLTQATEVAHRSGSSRAAAEAWGQLAELYADGGQPGEALALNERALFHAQLAGAPDAEFFAQWRAARLLQRAARQDDALSAYRRALASLQSIKADLASEIWAGRESFTDRIGPAYLGYADLLLRRAATESDGARKRQTLRQVQETLESFKQVEYEDYFRDDCVARYLARAKAVEQVGGKTAVLYPVPLADRLELVVSIGDAIHQVTVPVGIEAIGTEARALRSLLEKRTTYQYLPHARRLYDWLIRPLEPVLAAAGVDTLVLVPDRPFRSIPLGALHDGRDFLIARYAIVTAPSLTLTDPRPLQPQSGRMLASGLTEAVQGFAPLPYVESELSELGKLHSGTTLRDRGFTTGNIERELRGQPYSIVHIASHAKFEADSRRSFVLTYDGQLTMDRLEDNIQFSRFREAPVELLFLSACQTAAGDERAALGLAGIAVKAGARSAVATLWHINDQASSLLVTEFYRQIGLPGVTKAEALRRAQLALLNDLRYRHPGYWSPFLMIGNWL